MSVRGGRVWFSLPVLITLAVGGIPKYDAVAVDVAWMRKGGLRVPWHPLSYKREAAPDGKPGAEDGRNRETSET